MPFESRDAFFSVIDSDGTTTRNLSTYLTGIQGLGERELVDVTRLGDSGHRFVASLYNGRFSLDGLYDKTDSVGADEVLSNLVLMTSSATTFVFGPTGTTSGASPVNRKITGLAWIRQYDVNASVGAAVTFHAEAQVDGAVTYTTFT